MQLPESKTNTTDPTYLPLRQVPRLSCMPRTAKGRPVHVSTVHRWAMRGVSGVRLQTWKVGRTRCTTRAALNRFFEDIENVKSGQPLRPVLSRHHRRASDEARAILSAKRGAA